MSSIVKVNYDELQFISKKLHGEADDFAHLHSSTVAKVNALRSEWVGDAATQFFNEMDGELLPALRRVTNALVVMNDVLKHITRIIREADEETVGYFGNISGGDDFGAGKFEGALDAALAGGGLGALIGGVVAGSASGTGSPGDPGAAGGQTGTGQDASGSGGLTDLPAPIPTQQDSATAAAEAQANAAEAGSGAGGGGGGGGGGSSGGMQGDLKNMGAGMDAAPAQQTSVGGSQGGVENLPEHNFGGSGGGAGSASTGSTAGGAGGSGGSAGAEGGAASGGSALGAGVAGVAGAAGIGAAAKVIKDKQDE